MMIAAGMSYPRGLPQLVLVLTFTAMGAQAECNHQEIIQMISCVSPYMGNLFPLAGSSCNKELISKDLCNDFKEIVDCVTKNKITPTCLEVGVSAQLKQLGFGCAVSDFQEKCPNATIIKTGDFVQTTSTPKETPNQTRQSPSKGQTNGVGGAVVTRTYLALLFVVTILLLFTSM